MAFLQPDDVTKREKALAWSVHLYTASGAMFGLLAILAAVEGDFIISFIWMCVTMLIDGLDGTLARRFRVKDVVPNFDGALLDNIVDYFTYVLVPLVIVYMASMIPERLLIATIALVSLSSAYQFCQVDAKPSDPNSDDHFFKGFPSYWNVVVMYLFLLDTGQWTNFIVLLACAILVFVPINYIYPSRTKSFQKTTMLLNLVWTVMFFAGMMLYPTIPAWLMPLSLFYIVYYIGVSLYLNFRPPTH